MMLADQVGANVAEDEVQEDPRDFVVRKGLDADRDQATVRLVMEIAVGDMLVWEELNFGTDALPCHSNAQGYCRFRDGLAEEVIREDNVASVRDR